MPGSACRAKLILDSKDSLSISLTRTAEQARAGRPDLCQAQRQARAAGQPGHQLDSARFSGPGPAGPADSWPRPARVAPPAARRREPA